MAEFNLDRLLGLKEFNSELEKSLRLFIEFSKTIDVVNSNLQGANGFKDFAAAQKAVNENTEKQKKSLSELEKIEKKLIETQKKLTVAQTDENKTLVRKQERLKIVNKELRDTAKAEEQRREANKRADAALNKNVKTILQAQKANKVLREAVRNTSTSTEEGRKKIEKFNTQINKNSAFIKKNSDEFLKDKQAIGSYEQSIKRALSSTGTFGTGVAASMNVASLGVKGLTTSIRALFLAIAANPVGIIIAGLGAMALAIKGIVTNAQDFTKANSELAAVLGKTREEITALTDQQKALGASTKFTATEVAGLQKEYAKFGFSEQQIIDVTAATLDLAAATGSDLSRSAEVAAATIKGFGLEASDTQFVVDVMAKSFSSSALDMESFAESMKLVAPIAKAANIPIETTTALLAQLADSGLKGSIAGTSLKNLLSKLGDENSKLSQELGYAVKNADDLERAFGDLSERNIDLTEATELTDERSKAAFLTLINGSEGLGKLTKSFKEAEGAARQMAITMEDNLTGDITLLNSAWDGLLLAFDDGDGVFTSLTRWMTTLLTAGIAKLTEGVNWLNDAYETFLQFFESEQETLERHNAALEKKALEQEKSNEKTEEAVVVQKELNEATKEFIDLWKDFDITVTADEVGEALEGIGGMTEEAIKKAETLQRKLENLANAAGSVIEEIQELEGEEDEESAIEKFKSDDTIKKEAETERQKRAEKYTDVLNTQAQAATGLFDIFSNLNASTLSGINEELSLLEAKEKKGEELTASELKRKKELEIEKAKINRKQAIADKAQAITNVLVKTAESIIGLWAKPGFPGAIPLTALVGGVSLTQLANIASAPLPEIPQFFRGTENAPAGWATIGEKGRELVHTKDGTYLSPDTATLINFRGGEVVKSNADTEAILGKNKPIINNEVIVKQIYSTVDKDGVKVIMKQGNSKRVRMQKYNLAM